MSIRPGKIKIRRLKMEHYASYLIYGKVVLYFDFLSVEMERMECDRDGVEMWNNIVFF